MHFTIQLLFILYCQLIAPSSSKYLYDDFKDRFERYPVYEKMRTEKNDPICDRLDESQYSQDNEESVADKIDWIKNNSDKFQKFLIDLNSENSLKSKRQAQFDKDVISYPEVVTNPIINNLPNPPISDGVMSYRNFLNFADSSAVIGNNSKSPVTTPVTTPATTPQAIPRVTNTTDLLPTATNKTKETECSRFLNSDNATAVLEKVLEELELIRKTKEGTATPEGAACDIIGSWNSEVIGLRFDISAGNDTTNDLIVKLNEHNPPKRLTIMNTNWTTSGYILKRQGGPFYLWGSKNKEDTLATFTGVCKNCGDVDTIFGTWSIVHPAKDCRDLQMAIETKRDIFRKESVHTRKQEKLSKIKKNSKSESAYLKHDRR